MERNTTENETRELNYGVTNFNNIFASLWNVFQFMDVMGWTGINYPVNFHFFFFFFHKNKIVCSSIKRDCRNDIFFNFIDMWRIDFHEFPSGNLILKLCLSQFHKR